MIYYPDTATYRMQGWKDAEFILRVLPKGQALRFHLEHEQEGTPVVYKLTHNEGRQLMSSLMHFFNVEVKER